ncbi:hypothetical protein B0O99DRAFT_601956 [Bisporella sp. PMI_857]|nr:hypothetical protein B0O99DRAFT_601956 [Bisporella sp. PMI_857]
MDHKRRRVRQIIAFLVYDKNKHEAQYVLDTAKGRDYTDWLPNNITVQNQHIRWAIDVLTDTDCEIASLPWPYEHDPPDIPSDSDVSDGGGGSDGEPQKTSSMAATESHDQESDDLNSSTDGEEEHGEFSLDNEYDKYGTGAAEGPLPEVTFFLTKSNHFARKI